MWLRKLEDRIFSSPRLVLVGVLLVLAAALAKSLRYEATKALKVPFESVNMEGAGACPSEYYSDWLAIMKYTHCKGLHFEGRSQYMKRPDK